PSARPASLPRLEARSYCRTRGIRVVETGPLDSADAVAAVRGLAADLGIHAGAGLLRPPLLGCFRLGVLNAHMGLLPAYRGVNVAEWARLNGDPVGCSVHVIDAGIDTGTLLATRTMDPSGSGDIAALRAAVNAAQVALLGEVLRLVLAS